MIEVVDVCKSFIEGRTQRDILKHLSMNISQGECVALVGKSGSGKSTLLNILSGVDDADSGQVIMNGVDITGMKDREKTLFRRKNIGFVFQSFQLIPFLTVEENIYFLVELNKMNIKASKDRIDALIDHVEIRPFLKSLPDKLSGGEKQRVAIVRALAHDPLIVLADEPTGNLDDVNSQNVVTLLKKITQESQKTLVVVTHSLEVAAQTDKVFKLHGGTLELTRNHV